MTQKTFAFFTGAVSAHSYFINDNHKLFSFGLNSHKQLARHNKEGCNFGEIPKEIFLGEIEKEIVKKIALGEMHSIFLTDKGKCYSVGNNNYNQLGVVLRNQQVTVEPLLVKVLVDKIIIEISAGLVHSVFLSDEGIPYSCGGGGFGQLGIASKLGGGIQMTRFPRKMSIEEKISDIKCGKCYTILVSKKNEIFFCGNFAKYYVLDVSNKEIPVKIKMPEMIEKISCGCHHMLFLGKSKKVYGYGHGKSYQFTKEHYDNHELEDIKCISCLKDMDIVDIKCGYDTSYVLTSSGNVFAFGSTKYNECGISIWKEDEEGVVYSSYQEELYLLKNNIIQIEAGNGFVFLFDKLGNSFCIGNQRKGRLGMKTSAIKEPIINPLIKYLLKTRTSKPNYILLFSLQKKNLYVDIKILT